MLVRRSSGPEDERINMIRHVKLSQLTSMGITLDSQCTHGKTSDYPQVLDLWDTLATGECFHYVLYLQDD